MNSLSHNKQQYPDDILATYEYLTKHKYPESLNGDYFPSRIERQIMSTGKYTSSKMTKLSTSTTTPKSGKHNRTIDSDILIQSPIRMQDLSIGSTDYTMSPGRLSHTYKSRNSEEESSLAEEHNLSYSSYRKINTNPSDSQVKSALDLLNKAERNSQKKLYRQLKNNVNQEILLMKEESEKRTIMRMNELQKREKIIEKKYSKWMKELNHISNALSNRSLSLIQKLAEMEVRQKIDSILNDAASQKKPGITYEEVKELSQKEQKNRLESMIAEARLHLRGRFPAILEEFSSIDRKSEREAIRKNIEDYVNPVLERRRALSLKLRNNSDILMSKLVNDIVEKEKLNVIKISDERLARNHKKKCIALEEVSKQIHLSKSELQSLLNLEVINYETDVGVADAEMEALRKNIDSLQNHMEETLEKYREAIEREKDRRKSLTAEISERRRSHDSVRNQLESLLDDEREIIKREKADTNNMLQKSIITCQKALDNTKRHIKSLTEKTNIVLEKHKEVSNEHQMVAEEYRSKFVANETINNLLEETLNEISQIENNSQSLRKQLEEYQYKTNHSSTVLHNRQEKLLSDKQRYISSQVMGRQLEQIYDLSCNLARAETPQDTSRHTLIGALTYLRELNTTYKERTQSLLDFVCYLKVILQSSRNDLPTKSSQNADSNQSMDLQLQPNWISLYEAEDHYEEQNTSTEKSNLPSLRLILDRELDANEIMLKNDYIRYITSKWVHIFISGEYLWRFNETFHDKASLPSNTEIEFQKNLLQNELLNEYSKQQSLAAYILKRNQRVSLKDDLIFVSPMIDYISRFGKEYTVTPLAQDVDILRQTAQTESKINGMIKPLFTKTRNILNKLSYFSAGNMQIQQLRIRQKIRLLKEEKNQQQQLNEKKASIALKNEAFNSYTQPERVFKINRFHESAPLDPTCASSLLIEKQRERFKNHQKFSPRSILLLQGNREMLH